MDHHINTSHQVIEPYNKELSKSQKKKIGSELDYFEQFNSLNLSMSPETNHQLRTLVSVGKSNHKSKKEQNLDQPKTDYTTQEPPPEDNILQEYYNAHHLDKKEVPPVIRHNHLRTVTPTGKTGRHKTHGIHH